MSEYATAWRLATQIAQTWALSALTGAAFCWMIFATYTYAVSATRRHIVIDREEQLDEGVEQLVSLNRTAARATYVVMRAVLLLTFSVRVYVEMTRDMGGVKGWLVAIVVRCALAAAILGDVALYAFATLVARSLEKIYWSDVIGCMSPELRVIRARPRYITVRQLAARHVGEAPPSRRIAVTA